MKCNSGLYWAGCYQGTFALLSPESIAHPAKMAPGLCFRILDHLAEMGLLKEGDRILDPMAGTGLTAICANAKGYASITVELEDKFVGFEHQNKEYAERRLYKKLDWQIIKGDARKLSELLQERGLVSLVSPPYANRVDDHGVDQKGYEGFTDKLGDYGTTPGQIGNLKDSPLKAITSPPYGIDMKTAGGIDWAKANRPDRRIESNPVTGKAYTRHNVYGVNVGGYGESDGQLGNLPDRPYVGLMSPPYEQSLDRVNVPDKFLRQAEIKHGRSYSKASFKDQNYGITQGQVGAITDGETYLSAMLQVYQEIAKVSDVLAIVIKNPTRAGKLRRLDLDTIKLLRMAGWKIHCQHRAQLFEEREVTNMFGETKKKVKGRLSFFKRLSYQKGQPVAAWEDVIVCVR